MGQDPEHHGKVAGGGAFSERDLASPDTVLVNVRRIDPDLPLPEYKTAGACGCDLYARVPPGGLKIGPHETQIIPCNIVIRLPEGYMGIVASRSSLPLKTPLMVANGIGIIDQDYCGENDEVGIIVYNRSDEDYVVHRGDRLGQLLVVKVVRVTFQEVERTGEKDRGGYGSTGR